MENCLFCKFVSGISSAHIIWEDDKHLAFLSVFPNTDGVTVVIPKKHYQSYAFELPDEILYELIVATKKVALLLDIKLDDVGRTAMVFEGYGIDHVHAKIFPMHGTGGMKKWQKIESKIDRFSPVYEGYISSHDSQQASEEKLKDLKQKIKSG